MPDLEQRVAALEAIVAQFAEPEPAFMDRVTTEHLYGTVLTVSLTHEPTGVTVMARDRQEAVYKLRKALAGHAARQSGLQHAERMREAKAAKEAAERATGAP